MTKEEFNKLDLREQVKGLKGKWYYDQVKWGLRANKHSVNFDGEIRFKLDWSDDMDFDENDNLIETGNGTVFVKVDDEVVEDLGDFSSMYDSDDADEILNNIVCYIANYF